MATDSLPYDPLIPGTEGWTTQRAARDGQTQYASPVFPPAGAIFGSGVPSDTVGTDGMYFFRSDTPAVANQRIYVKTAGAWVGIV